MKKVFLFPGQGAQKAGMGKDLYDAFECVRNVYDEADAVVDFDLKGVSFEGPQDDLNRTDRAQPAIMTLSVAVTRVLAEKGITPAACAGHSLGEYSALVAAGVLPFAAALKLVLVRGSLMMKACEERPGTMAALIGGSLETVEELCRTVASEGYCAVANFNSPDQLVVSGEKGAVDKLVALSKEAGIKRAVPLAVSGGFHSKLMDGAAEAYRGALADVALQAPAVPLFFNVNAKTADDPDVIRSNMAAQINGPVHWVSTINGIVEGGFADSAVEAGPGNVLKGLARKINRDFGVASVGDVKSLESLLSA